LHHHSCFLDKKRGRYIIFGGFGNRQYSKDFLSYNSTLDHWDTLQFKGDNISPRFYTSIAPSKQGDFLYIYGGVGNDSGDQSVGHNYYNDLYKLDLASNKIKKCWEIHSDEKLVPGERMILSKDEKYLYVLRYAEYNEKTHIQLYLISVEDGAMQKLGDSIPFISNSIASNIALYFNPELQEFYCITQEFDESTRSVKAQVFALSAPPVDKAAIEFYLTPKGTNAGRLFSILALTALCVFILLLIFILRGKLKKRKLILKEKSIIVPTQTLPSSISSKSSLSVSELSERISTAKTEFNKIYLYGIFTIYGKSGRDITYLFSNKLKQIFLYILLNSEKEGVSSALLNNLFWPEKTEEKVKNLKGVTISNLRKALTEIDGVELVYEKGFFKILISEPCYCDYFCRNTAFSKHSQSCDDLLAICERGQLLECTKQELFDKYKRILKISFSLFFHKSYRCTIKRTSSSKYYASVLSF